MNITVNKDTEALLKQLNSGCKTATNSVGQMLPYVRDGRLVRILHGHNDAFIRIGDRCHQLLEQAGAREEDPPLMGKAMTWLTTAVKMNLNESDQEAARIMADGCRMGIDAVLKARQEYPQAAPNANDLADELVYAQRKMLEDMRPYLARP